MAGFIRRYSFFPPVDQIQLIEGAVIVDLPPPGSIQGTGVGTVVVVGEFADVTYGVAISASGVVTTSPSPVEVFSAADLIQKGGGFDETLGKFGADEGNAFCTIRNKKFSRLIIVPVNLASSNGVRVMRQLPSNTSATVPNPCVPMQGAQVVAAREFRNSGNRARVMQAVTYSGTNSYASGVDGGTTNAAAAATTNFTSAGGAFTTCNGGAPVAKGDLIVIGSLAAAAMSANLLNAQASLAAGGTGTFRVISVTNATTLVIERMDGTNFAVQTSSANAWRIHPANTGDSGVLAQTSDVAGYRVPARPLDATISAGAVCQPTVAPASGTGTSWDPLSGLFLQAMAGGALTYTAAVQAPNAGQSASIDSLYQTAINSLLSQDLPEREANILLTSRTSLNIRNFCKQHVLSASAQGVGRVTPICPELNVLNESTVLGDADPGVGANRDERVIYGWPGVQTFIPEAVGFSIPLANGLTTSNGTIDSMWNGWIASLMSVLPPERNPGESTPTTEEVLAPVLGIQSGVSGLQMSDYILFRQKGIAAPRIDRTVGPTLQSGITTSLISGQKNINRRRMADYIEDSLAEALVQFAKLPLTNSLKDTSAGEVVAFFEELLSENNPAAQRIAGYLVDTKSGNTVELNNAGIYVIVTKVKTLATADFIVVQAEVGEGVNVSAT